MVDAGINPTTSLSPIMVDAGVNPTRFSSFFHLFSDRCTCLTPVGKRPAFSLLHCSHNHPGRGKHQLCKVIVKLPTQRFRSRQAIDPTSSSTNHRPVRKRPAFSWSNYLITHHGLRILQVEAAQGRQSTLHRFHIPKRQPTLSSLVGGLRAQ